ncbi:MAG TPA: PIN domain-containing protein [Phycisphaerae bacterium]|nr:PIN domain-containing protein [Phycisphaerae bacterium]
MSVFVDTGPWYASVVPTDPSHASVLAWLRQNKQPLITSDYVIDETLTLLRSRGEKARAVALGRRLLDLSDVTIHFLEEPLVRRAWTLFRDNPERGWSFTDCTSKVLMERLHVKQVLTFDSHFSEFGGLQIFP